MKYRPDIDGLRAIAVMSIVIFHLGIGIFPGGFVGVDIFFVISGYLISKIIYAQSGSFSIADFYVRRSRRILPALIATVIASSIAAMSILYASERVDFAKSAMASMLFSANIYFYSVLNYFSPSADQIPLLHLWSLGVEEQFYIFFPLIAIAVMRRWPTRLPVVLSTLMLGSLAASIWMLSVNPQAAFYLIPFRGFELLIGCLVALPSMKLPKSPMVSALISIAGLACIATAVFMYGHETKFPGLAAILPCIGSALVIVGGTMPGGIVARAIGARPFAYVGRISYSLYLVHWPIIVFGKRLYPGMNAAQFGGCALIASLLLAVISYHFVEQTFRHGPRGQHARPVLLVSAASILCVVLALGFAVQQKGFSRGDDARTQKVLAFLNYNPNPAFKTRTCFLDPDQKGTDVDFSPCLPQGPGPKAMLWGDSHAANLAYGFETSFRERGYSFGFVSASACPPILGIDKAARPFCRGFNDIAAELILKVHPKILVMAASWDEVVNETDTLDATIKKFTDQGIKVIVLGPSPFYNRAVPLIIADRLRSGLSDKASPLDLSRNDIDRKEAAMEKHFAGQHVVTYVSMMRVMCPFDRCPLVDDKGTPTAFDVTHLTTAGATLFANKLTPLILQ